MDPLEQALQFLDQAAAIIQELLAQLQAKGAPGDKKDMNKQAEFIASKTGRQYSEVAGIIKQAEEKGIDVSVITELFDKTSHGFSDFGKVASFENTVISSGSTAIDKYKEREAALLDSLS